ncbi:MAG TPA: hypothetical protein VEQ36_15940 [Thermomicrobiales bacterium]|nr:hypothetical protein [Thermomicrobiales bacterium]
MRTYVLVSDGFEDPAMQPEAADPSHSAAPHAPIYRWECGCHRPPVLLATFDLTGRIEIAQEDRYWQVNGRVATHCPKCGKEHLLQLRLDPSVIATLPKPWREERQ